MACVNERTNKEAFIEKGWQKDTVRRKLRLNQTSTRLIIDYAWPLTGKVAHQVYRIPELR